ncbi:hypothetical protein [Actinoplanes siamensis]|uniref:Uncharacterized protein n=1 Tax=Actinoplanes siamensis TaxID=1223317 RepID=A0A919NG38_9ACTN|nr:hypothetical protein [Actinoplanes siamensis]GIF09885.1 hypothetical protein Asi03nite_74230 [Actinoplanes siamensis]
MIDPGSRPVDGAMIEQAEANLTVFLAQAAERVLRLARRGAGQRQDQARVVPG